MKISWMKLHILMISLFCGGSLSFAQSVDTSKIRVRTEKNHFRFKVEGLGIQISGIEKKIIPVALPKFKKISIEREEHFGKYQWKIEGAKSEPIWVNDKNLTLNGFQMTDYKNTYNSSVILSSQRKKHFDIITEIPIETYLTGVLAGEVPLSWPLEALKAQAISARSYALAMMNERRKQIYHVDASIMDQVYSSDFLNQGRESKYSKIIQAVMETRGQYLSLKKLMPLKAYYHADCGGKTISAKSVWKTSDDAGTAEDATCPSSPSAKWKLDISEEDFKKKIGIEHEATITRMIPWLDSSSSKVEKIEISTNLGRKLLTGENLRAALGYGNLKSTQFQMSFEGKQIHFKGQGFGHAVGLCQWGTRSMALKGVSHLDILKHYYPKARIAHLQLPNLHTL